MKHILKLRQRLTGAARVARIALPVAAAPFVAIELLAGVGVSEGPDISGRQGFRAAPLGDAGIMKPLPEADPGLVSTATGGPDSSVTHPVTARIDVTRKRAIHGTRSLDRETWFGVYHETGYGRGTFTDGGRTLTYDEWIHDEGNMWPSRGTIQHQGLEEDPTRPSFIDPDEFSKLNGLIDWRYKWAKQVAPDHKTVLSGEGHGKYPPYMCWDPALTHNVLTVSNNVANGEAVVNTLLQIEERDGLMPKWFEVMNESSIQSNYGWHWDSDSWDKLSAFHAEVAHAVHASTFSNRVKVAGPTDAYPFRDGASGDFSQWEGTNRKFIEQAGAHMDAYAFHTYEQMTTNSTGNSCFDDQFALTEIWHLGRLRAFVDLWENEHHNLHGGTLPFVFSEYGLLTNRNPYGDENAYYQLRSCNGILLSLLDRPDVVDKMSAFLMSQAPYNWNQKRVFFASNDAGATRYKTSYFEYLRFWHDLEGDYLFADADSQHLALRSFLTLDGTLFVVMKNNFNQTFSVDVQAQLPTGTTRVAAAIQRLAYNGVDDVARTPYAPVADLGQVMMDPDETVLLRITLSSPPALLTWQEENHYGDRTLVPLTAHAPEDFVFTVPGEWVEAHTRGHAHISLYAPNGFRNPLTGVSVNGIAMTNVPDIAYTAGAVRSWKQIDVPIPAGVLVKGDNVIRVISGDGGDLQKVTSVRLTTESAVGDQDLDGMPDWWEVEHGLDPWSDADATAHNDDDGYPNRDEYICGTDPNDGTSALTLTGQIDGNPDRVRLSFHSVTNRLYAVEATEDLVPPAWLNLTNGIPGTDQWIEVTDDVDAPIRSYRIRVEKE